MKKFSELIEARGDTAVFTFGRFNPPTIGHEKVIDAVAKEQGKNPGAPMYVFPSHSNDPKKNPLPHALKVAYMKKMFRKYATNITVSKARNIFEVATFLHDKGHRAIVMVVGSDRVAEFDRLLNEYNGVQGKHGYYGFDNIEVKSAGERDPDAEGVEGMSASKMRAAAVEGDLDSFKQGVPSSFKDVEKLYKDVRKNMGIREERMMGELDFYEEMRDNYLTGKIWNVGDIIEANGMSGEIVRKGTNYISFMAEDGKVHKAWLSDIRLDEVAWVKKTLAKIDQMRHPKNYKAMLSDYVNLMKTDKTKMGTKAYRAGQVASKYDINGRSAVQYINKLVDNGTLPKELEAEYQVESDDSFTSFVLQMEKLRRVKQDPDVKDSPGTEPAKYFAKGAGGKELAKSTKQARARHFDKKTKMSDDDPRAYEPAPGDKKLKTKPSKHTKKFKQMFGEQKMECPPATKDLAINTKNRDAATKKYNYGPLNVDEPGDYWEKIAKHWKTTEEAAKKSLCENCVAFDVSPRMKECLPGATSDDDGELGYCWMHHFKCHSARACHTWAKGGPIDKDKESHNWQERAFGKSEKLDKDADAGDYVKDFYKSDAPQFKGKSKKKRRDMAIAAFLSRNEALLNRVDEMLTEDGHTDVASMKNKVSIAYKALGKMQGELDKLNNQDSLPTWWTNKVATAVSRIDDMADYIDSQVDESYQLDEKKIKGLVNKSEKSGMAYGILKKVYDRGMAAWRTGHRPGTTPQQWAFARVNSFITKSKGTWGGADQDLAKQVRGESLDNDIDESLWKNIHKKRERIKKGSGEKMRKKGEKGAPTAAQMKRAKSEEVDLDEAFPVQVTVKDKKGKTHTTGTRDLRGATHALLIHYKEIPASTNKMSLNYGKIKPAKTEIFLGTEGELAKTAKRMLKQHPSKKYATGAEVVKLDQKMVKGATLSETNEWGELTEKAEYDGRPVDLNNPTEGDRKKYKVYVRNDKGNVVKVEFGDPNMEIKRDSPGRLKAFRARHQCDTNPGPKWKARYWSCKFWEKGKTVTDLMKG